MIFINTTAYILTALCVVIIILLIAVLSKLSKNKTDFSADEIKSEIKNLSDKVSQTGSSTVQQNEALRTSVSASVSEMAGKVEKLSEKTHEMELNTVKAIGEMREKTEISGREQANAVSAAVEKLQQSNEKKLDDMRKVVDEKLTSTLTERLDSSFKTVSEQLGNVYKSLGEMKEISGGISTLNRVLSGVKTRGTWAESQLETILDSTIPGMYVKNYRPNESRDVVEFAVKIPSQDESSLIYMPIDSKFPMEDYLRLCDASDSGDAEGIKAARKALEARVLSQAKAVNKYIEPPVTTPFAVMYLATDSLYAEIVSSKENIVDRVHNDYKVLIAGPSTITALLSSLAMGFRTAALNKKASEVMDLLAAAKTQYEKFALALDTAKKRIDSASKGIEEAQHRNEIIVKSLKGVEALDSDKAENILQLE